MSSAGKYLKTGMSFLNQLEEGKPHTSVTDWIEVLSGDRYDELSLDGIPELVESVNIQGAAGTQEASRAIRKKLKYGNVHRQLRALVLLRALTENASKGFQLNWANSQIVERLQEMAKDTLLDPQVKKRLMLVFHAWSIQYANEPRMATIARLYGQYSGQPVRRGSVAPTHTSTTHSSTPTSPTSATSTRSRHAFGDIDDIYGHSWEPSAGARNSGGQNYSDLAAAKADAEARRAARDRQILIEQREAELERREREMKRKADMAALELRRQKDAAEEAERRRLMKENMRKPGAPQPKPKPKFDLQKEKPNIMVAVATAIQAANNLVNSMRHLNREHENLVESPRVQDNLDKAKAARRKVIQYVQVVNDEELVGTLLEANEKVVEAIQMYDKMSKPAALDSDSEHESDPKKSQTHAPTNAEKEMDALTRRMEAQRLEALRTSEMQKMQERQKRESAREAQRREKGRPTRYEQAYGGGGAYGKDLADLDFGSSGGGGGGGGRGGQLPRPLSPDSERGSFAGGSLSDFSDNDMDYDSSDEEYRRTTQSRNQSRRQSHAAPPQPSRSRRQSQVQPQPAQKQYKSLMDDDPFADDGETPVQENKRMQWAEI